MKGTRDTKWPAIASMWSEGLTSNAIASRLGMSDSQVRTEMGYMRREGWDLPYRRLSAQGVEACRAAGLKGAGGGVKKGRVWCPACERFQPCPCSPAIPRKEQD